MKYTLTDETKTICGMVLHRVKYEDGEMGGWIEKESNLSQECRARVAGGDLFCVSGLKFPITMTRENVVIGCQRKTWQGWFAVTQAQALKMGLPEDEYDIVNATLKLYHKRLSCSATRQRPTGHRQSQAGRGHRTTTLTDR